MVKKETEEKNNAKVTKTVKLDKNQTIQLYQNKEKELQGLSQRIEQIDNILVEMQKAELTLNQIKKLKTNEKILVNIGAGILVECEVSNKSPIKVMLPGNIMTEKDMEEVVADVEKRKKELIDAKTKLVNAYNQNAKMLEQISKVFKEMQARAAQKQQANNNAIE